MSDFFDSRKRNAAKRHTCEQCGQAIDPGTRHWECASVFDGQFYSYREHFECRSAWHTLNFDLRDYPTGDGAPFLRDDDHEADDKAWMRDEFPIVADRLGW